jgi:prepilin-type N-terminal cleavage/methylation domain-containing protein
MTIWKHDNIKSYPHDWGFTLMELLVVLAIIGLLTTTISVKFSKVRAKGRDVQRLVQIINLSTALELYYSDNGQYPAGCLGSTFWSGHSIYFGDCNSNYIEDMANYVSRLPIDPSGDDLPNAGYIYKTDGLDYKLMSYRAVENTVPEDDPFARCPSQCDLLSEPCSNGLEESFAVYSIGAACW